MPNTIPRTPDNLFVTKRNLYAVVQWDKVTEDVDGNPVVVKQYNVYRTQKTNSKEFVLVREVDTTDYNGDIDTIYVDIDIDNNEIYFYKVTCINTIDEESDTTQEETGWYFGDIADNNPEPVEELAARWDISLWDVGIWGS